MLIRLNNKFNIAYGPSKYDACLYDLSAKKIT